MGRGIGGPDFPDTGPLNLPVVQKMFAERINITSPAYIGIRDALDRARLDVYVKDAAAAVVCELQTHIYGVKGGAISIHRQWPRDWWEAVKERWFPAWVLRRWPVRYERIDVEETVYAAVCPHVNVPERREHFQWMNFESQLHASRHT